MKNSIIILLSFILFVALISCEESSKKETKTTLKNNDVNLDISKGFQLLESNCFACHSPKTSLEDRIAPPMAAIKEYYITEGVTQEQFSQSLITFIENPEEKNAKIPEAIERFGLMPKMNFTPQQITQIANYIYNSKLEEPNWYANHFHNEKFIHLENLKNEDLSYEELGLKYAMNTKAVLGKNLIVAIKNKGTEEAVAFCNTRAFNIVDSAGVALNTNIKRVSDFPRNTANKASSEELNYIKKSKNLIENGKKLMPIVQEINNKMVGYYPIVTNQMCLQCHGMPNTQILPTTLSKIKELYPTDKATGYGENELRGIWVIEMDKK
ncbi:MAG: DUF3365 domain-containing protein [Lutibacter sp.]|uniref:c-type heme family protein n=1 Tax=Lutibacter sp. TaxID=1925666 RepID=UPI0017C19F42|nr:DUF3365 domain-containing protein [Lutibacter sp.]MBT8316351.1 DUF3365 domain-containing protein [Lutibacter sp.]NNJ57211.1 DUF3365 domain-containing protein [Lutibacter sp.]